MALLSAFSQPPTHFLHRNVQGAAVASAYTSSFALQPPHPFLRQQSKSWDINLISTRHSVQKVTRTPLMKAQRANKYKTKFRSVRVSVSSLTACHCQHSTLGALPRSHLRASSWAACILLTSAAATFFEQAIPLFDTIS